MLFKLFCQIITFVSIFDTPAQRLEECWHAGRHSVMTPETETKLFQSYVMQAVGICIIINRGQ